MNVKERLYSYIQTHTHIYLWILYDFLGVSQVGHRYVDYEWYKKMQEEGKRSTCDDFA